MPMINDPRAYANGNIKPCPKCEATKEHHSVEGLPEKRKCLSCGFSCKKPAQFWNVLPKMNKDVKNV